MEHKEPGRLAPLLAMALFGLMLACVLGLMALGSGLYGSVTRSMTANNAARASLRYLTTSVRAADTAAGLRLEDGPEGVMLVLEEPSTGYETRIYLWEGQLVEEYTAAESYPAPENAQPVCACTRFEAERSGSLLELTTDQGTARVALRCAEGE